MEHYLNQARAQHILSVYGIEKSKKKDVNEIEKDSGESQPLRDFHGKGEFDADGLEPTVKPKK